MLTAIASFLLRHLVFMLMLSVGLAAKPQDFMEVVRQPRLYVRTLLVMELGVPLLAMTVISMFDLSGQATALILIMAICPGAPFIPMGTKTKGETHSPVGLNLLILASLFAPLMIPSWIVFLRRVFPIDLEISASQVLQSVVVSVLAPLLLGLVIRRLLPRAAEVVSRVVHYFFLAALAVALVAVLYLGAPKLLDVSPLVLLAALLVVVGSELMGYWAAEPQPEERRTTSVAAVLGNPGLALAIITASYPGFKAAAFIAAYLIFRKVASIPFEQWVKHRQLMGA